MCWLRVSHPSFSAAIFAIILFKQNDPWHFGNLHLGMITLFRMSTLEDWTDVMYEVMVFYPLAWIYFLTFIFFSAFAFLNMLIAIVVDVVNKENKALNSADSEDERHKQELMDGIKKISGELERLKDRLG